MYVRRRRFLSFNDVGSPAYQAAFALVGDTATAMAMANPTVTKLQDIKTNPYVDATTPAPPAQSAAPGGGGGGSSWPDLPGVTPGLHFNPASDCAGQQIAHGQETSDCGGGVTATCDTYRDCHGTLLQTNCTDSPCAGENPGIIFSQLEAAFGGGGSGGGFGGVFGGGTGTASGGTGIPTWVWYVVGGIVLWKVLF